MCLGQFEGNTLFCLYMLEQVLALIVALILVPGWVVGPLALFAYWWHRMRGLAGNPALDSH